MREREHGGESKGGRVMLIKAREMLALNEDDGFENCRENLERMSE